MDTIREILADADKDIKTILKHNGNNYLRLLLEAAFIPEKKLLLPEGNPPFNKNNLSDVVTKSSFWQVARKIDIFQRSDVRSVVRETSFIHALEAISEKDAEILLAVKDQTLHTLFPNLTYDNLVAVGYRFGA